MSTRCLLLCACILAMSLQHRSQRGRCFSSHQTRYAVPGLGDSVSLRAFTTHHAAIICSHKARGFRRRRSFEWFQAETLRHATYTSRMVQRASTPHSLGTSKLEACSMPCKLLVRLHSRCCVCLFSHKGLQGTSESFCKVGFSILHILSMEVRIPR